jgi:hypothetical protein
MSKRHLGWCAVLAATALAACGEGRVELAAVPVDSGRFGAMVVSSEGEQLLPVVARDPLGTVTALTGAVWMDGKGASAVVDLDPATGLPTRTVMGDYIVLFSHWSADRTTADMARIYGPTGYAEVYRGVRLDAGIAAEAGRLTAAATCLPDCPSKERTTAELIKLAGLGLSIGTCAVATGISWGAALLPCSGVVVSSAKMLTGDESWLNAPLERAGKFLKGVDILQCLAADPGACVSLALDQASGEYEKKAAVEERYQALVKEADDRLMMPGMPAGLVSGSPPVCDDAYECTPGNYLPCYPEGTKQCKEDCHWGDCPKPTPAPSGMTQCSGAQPSCQCTFEACATVTTSGHCTGWYKSSAGNFICASCQDCTGAAQALTSACCPDTN